MGESRILNKDQLQQILNQIDARFALDNEAQDVSIDFFFSSY